MKVSRFQSESEEAPAFDQKVKFFKQLAILRGRGGAPATEDGSAAKAAASVARGNGAERPPVST